MGAVYEKESKKNRESALRFFAETWLVWIVVPILAWITVMLADRIATSGGVSLPGSFFGRWVNICLLDFFGALFAGASAEYRFRPLSTKEQEAKDYHFIVMLVAILGAVAVSIGLLWYVASVYPKPY